MYIDFDFDFHQANLVEDASSGSAFFRKRKVALGLRASHIGAGREVDR
jgi:hypothetical protein